MPAAEPGFCGVATVEEIREFGYVLTPGRYVGASEDRGEDEPFEERFPKLVAQLHDQIDESQQVGASVIEALRSLENVG